MRRALSILLSLLSLVTFGLIAHNFYLSRSLTRAVAIVKAEPPLEYGDRVNENALQLALNQGGYKDQLKSHKYLLLYFLQASDFQHLKSVKYGEVLLQWHGGNGLQVFAVTNAQPDEILGTVKSESLTLPILFDKDGLLKFLLRVPDHYQHTYLLTSTGEVVFSTTGTPQEDVIRQIVEKYVAGKIDYDLSRAAETYHVGEQLPSLSVAHVTGGATENLLLHGKEVVLISARCTTCQLHGYIQLYRKLATLSGTSKPRILIFSRRFPQREVAEALISSGVPLENVYIARQPLGDLDNEYRTKSGDGESSIVIEIDQEGRIAKVKPMSSDK